jgi:HprK-related kinase B
MLAEGEHGPRMHGVAKHPRINPGTALNNPDLTGVLDEPERARYQGLPADDLWRLERKYDALVEKCFGPGRFTLAAPLSGLVLLNWQRDGGPLAVRAVDPGRRLDLLAALIKAPGLFCPAAEGGRPAEEYARLLHGCAVMEFSGGVDFAAGAAACLEFLRTGGIPA